MPGTLPTGVRAALGNDGADAPLRLPALAAVRDGSVVVEWHLSRRPSGNIPAAWAREWASNVALDSDGFPESLR